MATSAQTAREQAARQEEAIQEALGFVRTTVIGGALFLLPIFLIVFVASKIVGLMKGLTDPLVDALGVTSFGGVAVSTLITVLGIVIGAFLAGLLARTAQGQRFMKWIQDGVSATLPQVSLLQDVARNVGHDETVAEMPVVLVPTDAGWALGLLLEAEGDWHAIYLPGAPEMSSGSIAYAHIDQIHRTDLTLKQLWLLLRGRGKGSSDIYKLLAKLKAAGEV